MRAKSLILIAILLLIIIYGGSVYLMPMYPNTTLFQYICVITFALLAILAVSYYVIYVEGHKGDGGND